MQPVKLPVPPLALGEGPLWVSSLQTLFWVDILGRKIYGYREGEGVTFVLDTPDVVGFLVPWSDGLIAGVRNTLCHVHLNTRRLTPLLHLPFEAPLRFNDGKCDPEGRLWVGVMNDDRPLPGETPQGRLLCLDGENVLQTLAPMDISNGMAWTSDGFYYHADTTTHRIDRYRRLPDGAVTDRQMAVDCGAASPDGLCIDAEGMLWVALWGSGCVQRFDPCTGQALPERVELPEEHTSCCCFGGEDLRTLYITTAEGKTGKGGLYSIRTPVAGTLPHPCLANFPVLK